MSDLYMVSPKMIEGLDRCSIGDVITVRLVFSVDKQGICPDDGKTILSDLTMESGKVMSVGRSVRAAFKKSKMDATDKPNSQGLEPQVSVNP